MKGYIWLIISTIVVLAVMIVIITLINNANRINNANQNPTNATNGDINNKTSKRLTEIEKDSKGNAIINTEEITDIASFYTYTVDDVKIRIFAVKASDGIIRTAFNTCQICSPSPLAYFIQKGSNFKCQNCGNLFATDKIGIEKGECNPIPITIEERTEENNKIIINKSFIEEYKENFQTI